MNEAVSELLDEGPVAWAGLSKASMVFSGALAQRVHVGTWYILRALRRSHMPTVGPKYVLDSYMDPLGGGGGLQICLMFVLGEGMVFAEVS